MIQNRVDRIFRAFADPNRLRILYLLTKGEQCVCDLMDVLRMGQSKVSRHLSYLRKAGLVESRKEGLWVYYALSKPIGEVHRRLLGCLDCCLEDVPPLSRDLKKLKSRNKNKMACC